MSSASLEKIANTSSISLKRKPSVQGTKKAGAAANLNVSQAMLETSKKLSLKQ